MRKLSNEELAFFRKHPELIQAFGDKTKIYRLVLISVFVAGYRYLDWEFDDRPIVDSLDVKGPYAGIKIRF